MAMEVFVSCKANKDLCGQNVLFIPIVLTIVNSYDSIYIKDVPVITYHKMISLNYKSVRSYVHLYFVFRCRMLETGDGISSQEIQA